MLWAHYVSSYAKICYYINPEKCVHFKRYDVSLFAINVYSVETFVETSTVGGNGRLLRDCEVPMYITRWFLQCASQSKSRDDALRVANHFLRCVKSTPQGSFPV